MYKFDPFAIPFLIGFAFVIGWVIVRMIQIFIGMPKKDKKRVFVNIFTFKTVRGIGEIISEVLIHHRIWRENKLLGFMHMSFALGWFLLIVTGWIESSLRANGETLPIWQHIFYKYFFPGEHVFRLSDVIKQLMDLWLAVILLGQLIAVLKRFFYRRAGIKIRTRHSRMNRIALTALWFIFPLRLLAESCTASLYGGGGFLTGSLGQLIAWIGDASFITYPMWWAYSIALGVFFCVLPFSRYLHIPVEAFLILARRWRVSDITTINRLETMACSACGMCLSDCPLARNNIAGVQPVYFIERLRDGKATTDDAWKCLQCGRCQQICPVRVHANNLRQELKGSTDRVEFGLDTHKRVLAKRVTLFSGCMGKLTPRTKAAMEKILNAAGVEQTWIDEERDLCCGRPLRFNGNQNTANQKFNELHDAILETRPDAIVTTCPICFNMMKNRFETIPVYHHTDYIRMLIEAKRIDLERSEETLTYHDPCELSRQAEYARQPLKVLNRVGTMLQPEETGEKTRCCGGAVAAIGLNNSERKTLAQETADYLSNRNADKIVTACPLCKKTIAQRSKRPVADFAEIVADALVERE
ncbi:MAG: (Fe-S)-binding protein [Bacteroidales bacterium]|nr:(Fe-S)-binding protein [Bacteroidales bacterium]